MLLYVDVDSRQLREDCLMVIRSEYTFLPNFSGYEYPGYLFS